MSRPNMLLGAMLASAAGIGFAANSTAAKVAYEGGTNPLTFLTLRSVLAAVLVLIIIVANRRSLRMPMRRRLAAFAIGGLLAVYSYGTLASIQFIPVALAILILYTFPLLTSIYTWVSGQERPTFLAVGALLVAFFGLVLALDIQGDALDLRGVGLAAMAALGLTTVIILNNRLVGDGDSQPITFHMMLSASIVFAVVTWIAGDYALPETLAGWTGFLIGPSAYAAAIVTVFVAISLAGPAPAAMSMNVEPVASLTFGFLILGQALSSLQILGAGLVIAAVLSLRLSDIRIPGAKMERKP
ncbi:MAG: DMT family transporter [Rhodospirillaceae bacterium]|nr:DMT family transporter [Rhodospirillaceae bacterium]